MSITTGKKARQTGGTRFDIKRSTMRSRNARARDKGKTYVTTKQD